MKQDTHRYMRRGGNIGCMVGLVAAGLCAMTFHLEDAQLKLALVTGVLLGAAIGMVLGGKKDRGNAPRR